MSDASGQWATAGPVRGVIFDLHSTLVDQGSAREWLERGLRASGHQLDPDEAAQLVAFLDRIWENARVHDPDSLRDLSAAAHHRVFHQLLAEGPGVDPELGDALYECLLDTWHAYDDAVPVLEELRSAGIRIAVLSNVGVDVQHVLDREGLAGFADATVLSWQVGSVKPDSPIFLRALELLGLAPQEVLMVGDSGKDDAGAAFVGIRTLILPRTSGPVHGLAAVTSLVMGLNASLR
jgi:HAD superfamily hydrolase (TIGR01509 family)